MINLLVLFGGQSSEHDVSIMSARNITKALDPIKYSIYLVGIDRQGGWHHITNINSIYDPGFDLNSDRSVAEIDIFSTMSNISISSIDVIFPILHGPNGEDGTVQGLAKLLNIPIVGTPLLGSAINMDKDVTKRLLRDAGIPTAQFMSFHISTLPNISYSIVSDRLGLPFFIKPANLGSSMGISKVHNQSEFLSSLNKAFSFDTKIIIEEAIVGREIECSVLGNNNPIASIPGEIVTTHEYYDYQAKYCDNQGTQIIIPAKLSSNQISRVKNLAIKAFLATECRGMARVDMFLTDSDLFISELNTIPGFTNNSMYPKLWEASGISYSKLLDKLIQLALE